ncbi:MAG: hypothetical protein HON90_04460 [Halobacteriovoraceae bacterium]|jgi:hypothetical protein|nr:hypothetical protein [Halobacteriovoraceae bacterium]
MKDLLLGLTVLISISSFANNIKYSNEDGCSVEQEQRANGVVLYVTKGDEKEVVGYGNDYSFGDFSYCAEGYTDIHTFEGSQGLGIMISCSGHVNGHKTTRGRVDISIMGEQLSEVKIDGQIKGFFGWKQDVKLECLNLVQE